MGEERQEIEIKRFGWGGRGLAVLFLFLLFPLSLWAEDSTLIYPPLPVEGGGCGPTVKGFRYS